MNSVSVQTQPDHPQGWAIAKLKQLISESGLISDGDWIESKDQDPNGSIRLVQLADIGDGKFLSKSSRFMTSEASKRLNCTHLIEGDVLIARMPDPLGRACSFPKVEQQSVTVVDVCLIRVGANAAILNELLKYWINSPQIRSLISMQASGSTRKRITRKKLEAFDFNVPPIAEQKRIVAKLDSLLAQVDTIQQRLNNLPNIIKRFRQSVLAAAVSGKLTEQWRAKNQFSPIKELLSHIEEERDVLKKQGQLKPSFGKYKQVLPIFMEAPSEWEWCCFDQISTNNNSALKAGPFGSALKKSDCTSEGYRVYGQEQVIAGNENLVSYYVGEEKYNQLRACSVQSGDILVSLVGTIGKVLILSNDVENGIINPRLVKLSLNENINRLYIKYYLDSIFAKDFFRQFSHGGTMEILNLGILKQLPIALPSIEEQCEIVRLVEQHFALADTLEINLNNAKQKVDSLTQSILAKAFKGELVPQDPNDEPADKLLERIQKARLEAETLEKAAKKISKSGKKTSKS